ncbi:hypothetical protein DFH06DRAFT_1430170 [Mycena polygramma]|nr:hypothetical protein DFH06DRAFT_1430170 [Mycena polygramma]
MSDMIHPTRELPAFLVKPVSRVCKYPLLFRSLVEASSTNTYPHYQELTRGLAAMKRVVDSVNEPALKFENERTALALETRVADWRGLGICSFGTLLLDDLFTVRVASVDWRCHVFLFKQIILFCTYSSAVPHIQRSSAIPLRLKSHILLTDIMQTQVLTNLVQLPATAEE